MYLQRKNLHALPFKALVDVPSIMCLNNIEGFVTPKEFDSRFKSLGLVAQAILVTSLLSHSTCALCSTFSAEVTNNALTHRCTTSQEICKISWGKGEGEGEG